MAWQYVVSDSDPDHGDMHSAVLIQIMAIGAQNSDPDYGDMHSAILIQIMSVCNHRL
jgi:hypothetical protein